jgi:hypothetical protein
MSSIILQMLHCQLKRIVCVGFCELIQDDQITLIKQGSFEVILARYTTLFTDKGMFLPDMTARIPRFVNSYLLSLAGARM